MVFSSGSCLCERTVVTTAVSSDTDLLTRLLDLVDVSLARVKSLEESYHNQIDQVYWHRLMRYNSSISPAQQSEEFDERTFLTSAFLTVVVVIVRRAAKDGFEEGRHFARQQIEIIGDQIDEYDVLIEDSLIKTSVSEFFGEQRELSKLGQAPASLMQVLSSSAKSFVSTLIH